MIKAIIGPMFGSKSSRLIDIALDLEKEGKKFKVFFPASCNKLDGYIYSRENDKKIKAIKVFDISDLYNNVNDCKIILLDEFTFMCTSQYIDEFMNFLDVMDERNIDVILAGLQLDYMGKSFDLTERVLPYCDEIVTTSAICEHCGKPASRQIRKIDGVIDTMENTPTLIMENENVVYIPLCRSCFRKLTGLTAIK